MWKALQVSEVVGIQQLLQLSESVLKVTRGPSRLPSDFSIQNPNGILCSLLLSVGEGRRRGGGFGGGIWDDI